MFPEGLGTSQGWLSPICPLTFHRSLKVDFSPPSGTELPAFNPSSTPQPSQVLLLANPQKVSEGPGCDRAWPWGGGNPILHALTLCHPSSLL